MDHSLTKLEEFIEDEWDEHEHPKHLDHLSIVADLMMLLTKVYGIQHAEQRHMDAIIKAGHLICDEFQEKPPSKG
jgi:hypothetical protein